METVVLNGALLPVRRPALVDRARDRPRLRRLSRTSRATSRSGRCSPSCSTCRTSSTRCSSSRSCTARSSRRRPRSTRSWTCSTRSPRSSTRRVRTCRASRGTSASRMSASATASGPEVLHGLDLDVPPGRRSRSSATPAPASRRSRSCSRASTTRARAGSRSTASTCATSRRRRCAASSASCRRRASSSPAPSRENIAFGRPDAPPEEVVARRPDGRRARVHRAARERLRDASSQERGIRLSLGQRQLVAFARALLADPRILILDEATSSVDIGTERKIEHALRTLLAGRTAFVIAHRLSTIRDADLIVVLEHGQIVEQGTHDELMRAGASTPRCTATGPPTSPRAAASRSERRKPATPRSCNRALRGRLMVGRSALDRVV